MVNIEYVDNSPANIHYDSFKKSQNIEIMQRKTQLQIKYQCYYAV